jgi:hypothetical protein
MPLAMIWIYLDESGVHNRESGRLEGLVLGGGISDFASWEALSLEWAATLDVFEISMFHMADFEARERPFKGWPDTRRHTLLNALLDIACKHVPIFFGTVDKGDKSGFRARYDANLAKAITRLWGAADRVDAPITVVLAAHAELSAEHIGRHFAFWNQEGRLKLGGFANPACVCPLQVADIAAYEFSRAARSVRPAKMRYPLERLKSRTCCLMQAGMMGVVEL